MGSNNTTRAIPVIVITLVLILLSSGAQAADSGEASAPPTMARHAGPVPPPSQPPKSSSVPDQDCSPITVPALIDACRRPPGLAACAAQCIVFHYRGGYCDVLPNGRPGDCFCQNCLTGGQRRVG